LPNVNSLFKAILEEVNTDPTGGLPHYFLLSGVVCSAEQSNEASAWGTIIG
jgi:hypothetical protein